MTHLCNLAESHRNVCGGRKHPLQMSIDAAIDFAATDSRRHPELYRIGRGEQGVLLVQPYKRDFLPLWRFRTPAVAQKSADAIYALYLRYRAAEDFVGIDMARKFLPMGWTRSRRYANHRSRAIGTAR